MYEDAHLDDFGDQGYDPEDDRWLFDLYADEDPEDEDDWLEAEDDEL